jgi:hypothetical protein
MGQSGDRIRTVEGPCFIVGPYSIEQSAESKTMGFMYRQDVLFVPPGCTAEIPAQGDLTSRGQTER